MPTLQDMFRFWRLTTPQQYLAHPPSQYTCTEQQICTPLPDAVGQLLPFTPRVQRSNFITLPEALLCICLLALYVWGFYEGNKSIAKAVERMKKNDAIVEKLKRAHGNKRSADQLFGEELAPSGLSKPEDFDVDREYKEHENRNASKKAKLGRIPGSYAAIQDEEDTEPEDELLEIIPLQKHTVQNSDGETELQTIIWEMKGKSAERKEETKGNSPEKEEMLKDVDHLKGGQDEPSDDGLDGLRVPLRRKQKIECLQKLKGYSADAGEEGKSHEQDQEDEEKYVEKQQQRMPVQQDYYMMLVLLEQQNEKRRLISRQEQQENLTRESSAQAPICQPKFAPMKSPQTLKSNPLPTPREAMERILRGHGDDEVEAKIQRQAVQALQRKYGKRILPREEEYTQRLLKARQEQDDLTPETPGQAPMDQPEIDCGLRVPWSPKPGEKTEEVRNPVAQEEPVNLSNEASPGLWTLCADELLQEEHGDALESVYDDCYSGEESDVEEDESDEDGDDLDSDDSDFDEEGLDDSNGHALDITLPLKVQRATLQRRPSTPYPTRISSLHTASAEEVPEVPAQHDHPSFSSSLETFDYETEDITSVTTMGITRPPGPKLTNFVRVETFYPVPGHEVTELTIQKPTGNVPRGTSDIGSSAGFRAPDADVNMLNDATKREQYVQGVEDEDQRRDSGSSDCECLACSFPGQMSEQQQTKQMLWQTLYPKVHEQVPVFADAARITGRLLDMHNQELINLTKDEEALNAKIKETIEYMKNKFPDSEFARKVLAISSSNADFPIRTVSTGQTKRTQSPYRPAPGSTKDAYRRFQSAADRLAGRVGEKEQKEEKEIGKTSRGFVKRLFGRH